MLAYTKFSKVNSLGLYVYILLIAMALSHS